MVVEKARMNAGTLAAAWNSGEYCLISKSVISQLPYLGTLRRDAEFLHDCMYGS